MSKNAIVRANAREANLYSSRGKLEELSGYLCAERSPRNFIISGGVHEVDKYEPLLGFLASWIGVGPIVVLHNGSLQGRLGFTLLETMVGELCASTGFPLWMANQQMREFEPLYCMNALQAATVLRSLAKVMGYSATPRFERVVKAHADILNSLDPPVPLSLSGFYWLCSFGDMGEFYDNIMALPCDESTAKRIWADLGVDIDPANNQFDLFRAIINGLAHEAMQSGWSPDQEISQYNCLEAVRNGAVFSLAINDGYTDLLLPYIAEELKACSDPYVLIVDGVRLGDAAFPEYLRSAGRKCWLGLVGDSVPTLMDDDCFNHLAEMTDVFVILKHSTGPAAQKFSELFGQYEHKNLTTTKGTGSGFFSILPGQRNKSVSETLEMRYRVMPEEIVGLASGQAIMFDAATDSIIHYN